MPGVQETGSEGVFYVQLTQNAFDFGREKSWLQRAQAGEQGRI
jgi:hypothetical protein